MSMRCVCSTYGILKHGSCATKRTAVFGRSVTFTDYFCRYLQGSFYICSASNPLLSRTRFAPFANSVMERTRTLLQFSMSASFRTKYSPTSIWSCVTSICMTSTKDFGHQEQSTNLLRRYRLRRKCGIL